MSQTDSATITKDTPQAATPTFLIIGAARSGTTALTKFMNQHPEVFVANPKEPHFMAFAGQEVCFTGPGDDVLMNRVTVTEFDKYQSLFANAGSANALGEGSVSSLYYHQQSISNIKKYAPDAKLIIILRNPIERAHSNFMYMTSRGLEPLGDLESALEDEERRISDNWHHIWHYTQLGMYADQVQAYLNAFEREQIKIVLFEDLSERADDVLREVFEFVGVDADFQAETKQEVNRSGKPKNKLLHIVMKLLGQTEIVKRCVKAMVPAGLRDKIRASNLSHPEMSASNRIRLTDLYRNDIERLEPLIGRSLTQWTISE